MSNKGSWNPGPKYRAYLNKIEDVLSNGEERTVRDVYYALEARGFPEELREKSYAQQLRKHNEDPDSHDHPDALSRSEWVWEFEYEFVKRAVKKGRRAGFIDPSIIFDSSRQAVNSPAAGYDDPQQFLDQKIRGIWSDYYEDLWKYQDTYVEVWLEKQALATVFEPICRQKGVRLEATRGDWSDSKVYEAAERLRSKIADGKNVKILYFGDYNPSGYHAPVSILDTLEHYGLQFPRDFPKSDDPRYYDPEHGLPVEFVDEDTEEPLATFDFERCAINNEHLERFDLPENPVPSSTDSHGTIKENFTKYVSDGKDRNVELNALKEFEREFLEDLIEEKIEEQIDDEVRERARKRVISGREALETAVEIDDSTLADEFDGQGL